MKASYHVVVSAGVAFGFQAIVNSWPATVVCFLSGVLIDIDHYIEYYIFKKKWPWRYRDLLNFCDYNDERKVFLIFHGYEYLVALWLIIYFFHLNSIFIGLALGLTVHLVFDQFTNPTRPLFYFITYRIAHQFEKSKMVLENYYKKRSI